MQRIGVVVLLAGGSAWGQGVGAPDSAQDEARAKALYQGGLVYYEQGRYQEALTQFEEAYGLAAKPALLYNIAQAYDRLDNLDRAIEYGQRYLDESPDAADRSAVTAWLRGLMLRKEERERAATAAPVTPPDPDPAAKPEQEAAVPAAEKTPGAPLLVAPTTEPESEAAPILTTTAAPPERWRPPAWSPWVALGVAVVAAGVGGYLGTRVLSEDVSYDDSRPAATGATVSLSVAGVAGASAAGLWIWRIYGGDTR